MSEADLSTKWIALTVNQIQTVVFGLLAKGMMCSPLCRSHLPWLSCVVFGVFVGLCFVDLLSEAITMVRDFVYKGAQQIRRKVLETTFHVASDGVKLCLIGHFVLLECDNFEPGECSDNRRFMSTWPFFMIGFFVLRIIEYLLRKMFSSELCYRYHDTKETMENRENRARKHAATITLVFCLMLYSAVEGIRLFVQSVYSNFACTAFGRVIPYSIVALSIALMLSEASVTVCLVALALIFSSGFLGGIIGYFIQNDADYYVGPLPHRWCNMDVSSVIMARKILAQTLLGAITFFTFFMVKPECSKELTKPHYWVASAIGFAIYGGLTYLIYKE